MKSQNNVPQDGSMLPVVEEFYSIQGEGFHTGKPAYFLRIGGCDVGCRWCDSKFSWNPDIHPLVETSKLVENIAACPAGAVVVTGGEPLMYNLEPLTLALKERGIKTFLETSGSHPLTGIWDWICLSPKRNQPPMPDIYPLAGELKLIIADNKDYSWAEESKEKVSDSCELYLQPEWSVYHQIIDELTRYIMNHPHWKISLQSHKFMHIP